MEVRKPQYFDEFCCVAAACPDSCCQEWEVAVDPESAERYRGLPGSLGQRLRQVLRQEDGLTLITIENRRCPMWRQDGLCRIQAELGHEALCATCREFPRLRHDYGDFVELGLELSCPEAARMILSRDVRWVSGTQPDGEEAQYDREAMEILLRSRTVAEKLLEDPGYSVPQALALLLLYGYGIQGELDGAQALPFDPDAAMETACAAARPGPWQEIPVFFQGLEILTPSWRQRLSRPEPGPWQAEYRRLARYFVDRYWLQAVSDYDLVCRVKFAVIACLLIRLLGGDMLTTAQLLSKEIENNTDNVEALLDAAYTHPAFTDDRLLWLLLEWQT